MIERVTRAVGEAARDARRAWGARAWFAVGTLAMAAAVPPLVLDRVALGDLASGLYVVLAAVGLNFSVGLAGLPSLGQGGFVGIGAFGAALLQARAGSDPITAILVGTAAAAVAGALVGAGAIRLRPAWVAVATWVVAWLVAFALASFPGVFGGAQGLPLPPPDVRIPLAGAVVRLTPAIHFGLALGLVVLALGAHAALRRSPAGLGLAAVREAPALARAAGVRRVRLLLGAFVASAAIGGLAGGLSVQLSGIADPTAYGAQRSLELFVAVVLGGAAWTLGPVVGAAALASIPPLARVLGGAIGVSAERFEPAVAAALLVGALALGRDGVLGWWRRGVGARAHPDGSTTRRGDGPGAEGPAPGGRGRGSRSLRVEGVRKRFGGLLALDGVSLEVRPGQIHALVGPNGSGKTTLLRAVGGVEPPDEGAVLLDGREATGEPPRARLEAGLARTLQRAEVVPGLTALEHVVMGSDVRRRSGGVVRSLLSTPSARLETRRVRREAEDLLRFVGLDAHAGRPAERVPAGDVRFLSLAVALAARPSVLLLDEPSAGMSAPEAERLAALLSDLRDRGMGILLVEHDFPLVLGVADVVTVLDAGRVLATGPPATVAADPAVAEVYLGE